MALWTGRKEIKEIEESWYFHCFFFFNVFNFWSYMLEAWLCKPLCRWVVFPCITPLLRPGALSWCLSAAAAPGHCWQLVEISEYWYKTGGLSVTSDGAWESIVSDTSKGVTCFDRISWIYSNRLVESRFCLLMKKFHENSCLQGNDFLKIQWYN